MSLPSAASADPGVEAPFVPTYGAALGREGMTRFRVWAPSAARVELEREGAPAMAMTPTADGDFVAEAACAAGSAYRYRVFVEGDETGLAVPDPASKALRDGVDGYSLVVDPMAYEWQHSQWRGRPWEETVIYEVHLGACGGIDGLKARLPALVELGVTAIELMPLAECPGKRNWGYDGVQPYAVAAYYGTPEALKALVDAVHGHGLMIFLDVVYNHFGPDGNFLPHYAQRFFREDLQTPWGAAIDFREPQVRRFFIDNALMWLADYRFDGLRFDAVHAIGERDFLVELQQTIRREIDARRHCHLILENEHNESSHLGDGGFDAQWADDWHNVMHVLLTGEREGYYADFVDDATEKLATVMQDGFIYQGQPSRKGAPRGEPSGHLPATAFVNFLQNHDQIGNRALGDRLTTLVSPPALEAATLALLLTPPIPLIFMGEEWGSERPFLFFTDHRDALADAVREGRRREFADFSAFEDAAQRERIPDPNAVATFEASSLEASESDDPRHRARREQFTRWLGLRHRVLVPRLEGASGAHARVLSDRAVEATWRLGDGCRLTLRLNLADEAVEVSDPLMAWIASRDDIRESLADGELPPHSAALWLEPGVDPSGKDAQPQ
ncbi:malto-oligosyltrehalose trehalohydrolase [Salinicola aestuarinus]|uniref:malto-oligosyltrehalose trehalohydrolase n=1 Tax=Salinicola aestuarinus TaxID=1949082 RepID=UPI000DA17869|nr:malto-oligosyltrehalose trehalohydrolase [Salinicola aestuarinus]